MQSPSQTSHVEALEDLLLATSELMAECVRSAIERIEKADAALEERRRQEAADAEKWAQYAADADDEILKGFWD